MPNVYLARDTATTINAYPHDGSLVELTAAELTAELGIASGLGVIVQDEGVTQTGLGDSGSVDTINFVGAGVSATVSGTTATVTISGGSGSSGEALAAGLL